MSVELDPTDLSFRRPFNKEVTELLRLRNNSNDAIAFKVKTTAPKHYCVRPNSGRIEPGKHVEVQVLLQAMKEQPAPDAKCKDKFLVQSVPITGDLSFSNITSIFENAQKASIQERKIRVTWLPEEANGQANEESGYVDGNAAAEDAPPAYTTSPGGTYETPAAGLSKKNPDSSPISQPDFNEKSKADSSTSPDQSTTVAGAIRSTVAKVIPTSSEELNAQLADAHAQIQRLKDQVANQARVGKGDGGRGSSDENVRMMQQQHPSQSTDLGVPLQVVAGLCLLSFLLAYFFF